MDLCRSRSSRSFVLDQATRSVRRRAESTKPRRFIFYCSSIILFFVFSLVCLLDRVQVPELCPPVATTSPNFELLTEIFTSFTEAIDSYPEIASLTAHLNANSLPVRLAGGRIQRIKLGSMEKLGVTMQEMANEIIYAGTLASEWSDEAQAITGHITHRLNVMSEALLALDNAKPTILENLQETVTNIYCRRSPEERRLSSKKRAALQEIYATAARRVELLSEILVFGNQLSEGMLDFRRKSSMIHAGLIEETKSLLELQRKVMSTWLARLGFYDYRKAYEINTTLPLLDNAMRTLNRFNEPLTSRFITLGSHIRLQRQLEQLKSIDELSLSEHISRINNVRSRAG